MSADNWTYCPFCKQAEEAKHAKRVETVQAQYGKIPAAEYISKLRDAEVIPTMEETMREDWEIGLVGDGEDWFSVSYSCSCSRCNRSFTFKHEQKPDWKP